jgi:hypothetical protein
VARSTATGTPRGGRWGGGPAGGGAVGAQGRCLNRLGVHLNPNLFTVNCLTEWRFGGITAFGEDHDNWSAPAARRFFRAALGYEGSAR